MEWKKWSLYYLLFLFTVDLYGTQLIAFQKKINRKLFNSITELKAENQARQNITHQIGNFFLFIAAALQGKRTHGQRVVIIYSTTAFWGKAF